MSTRNRKLAVVSIVALLAVGSIIVWAPRKSAETRHQPAYIDPESAQFLTSTDVNNVETVEHAEKNVETAMRDPDKVRLMECIGVNPWKVKPANWQPPTAEECKSLDQKLSATTDANPSQDDIDSKSLPQLITDEEGLNDKCRDGSGDDPETIKACDERDLIFRKLKSKGWCWGHEGQVEADKVWESCKDEVR